MLLTFWLCSGCLTNLLGVTCSMALWFECLSKIGGSGFDPQSSHTKDNSNGCLRAWYSALRVGLEVGKSLQHTLFHSHSRCLYHFWTVQPESFLCSTLWHQCGNYTQQMGHGLRQNIFKWVFGLEGITTSNCSLHTSHLLPFKPERTASWRMAHFCFGIVLYFQQFEQTCNCIFHQLSKRPQIYLLWLCKKRPPLAFLLSFQHPSLFLFPSSLCLR